MRNSLKSYILALFAFVMLFSAMAGTAKANTYSIGSLGDDNNVGLDSFDTAGDLYYVGRCPAITCFFEITAQGTENLGTTPPVFTNDDGTLCAAPSGDSAFGSAVCNGPFIAFLTVTSDGIFNGFDAGTLGDLTHFSGDTSRPLVASNGDIAFDDEGRETVDYGVLVVTTPEPSSIALLGSGIVGIAGLARRRFTA